MNTAELHPLQLGMHFDPSRGGADRYFADLCSSLREIGCNVTSAAFGAAPGAGGDDVSLGSETAPLPTRLLAVRKLRRRLANPQSLLASHFAFYAWPLATTNRRVPHVVHFHGPWAGESRASGASAAVAMAKAWIERRVYHRADALIALSQAFANEAASRYAVAPGKIHVVPGGVDLRRFTPGTGRAAARESLGWRPDRRVIFCVRRLVPRMGVDCLIRAFAKAELSKTCDLVIGGSGASADALRVLARECCPGEVVRFAGFIPEKELPDYYRAADCSVVPSQSLEGFGLVAGESLACGTPAIVTPVGGLPEAVSCLRDHALIASGTDVDALEQILRKAMSCDLPQSQECRDFAVRRFDWIRIAERIATIYRSAADSHS